MRMSLIVAVVGLSSSSQWAKCQHTPHKDSNFVFLITSEECNRSPSHVSQHLITLMREIWSRHTILMKTEIRLFSCYDLKFDFVVFFLVLTQQYVCANLTDLSIETEIRRI